MKKIKWKGLWTRLRSTDKIKLFSKSWRNWVFYGILTTVKPTGTTRTLMGIGDGIHPPVFPPYRRDPFK